MQLASFCAIGLRRTRSINLIGVSLPPLCQHANQTDPSFSARRLWATGCQQLVAKLLICAGQELCYMIRNSNGSAWKTKLGPFQ